MDVDDFMTFQVGGGCMVWVWRLGVLCGLLLFVLSIYGFCVQYCRSTHSSAGGGLRCARIDAGRFNSTHDYDCRCGNCTYPPTQPPGKSRRSVPARRQRCVVFGDSLFCEVDEK